MQKKYVIVHIAVNGDKEYVTNKDGFPILFNSVLEGFQYTRKAGGYIEENVEVNNLTFERVRITEELSEPLKEFVFKVWDCNEKNLSVSYKLDDFYTLEATAEYYGWDIRLMLDVKGEEKICDSRFVFRSDFYDVPVAIYALLTFYNEIKTDENRSLQELLTKKLRREWDEFIEKFRERSIDEIIDYPNELALKNWIVNNIITKMDFSDIEIKTILGCKNLLNEMYEFVWQYDPTEELKTAITQKVSSLISAENDNK